MRNQMSLSYSCFLGECGSQPNIPLLSLSHTVWNKCVTSGFYLQHLCCSDTIQQKLGLKGDSEVSLPLRLQLRLVQMSQTLMLKQLLVHGGSP